MNPPSGCRCRAARVQGDERRGHGAHERVVVDGEADLVAGAQRLRRDQDADVAGGPGEVRAGEERAKAARFHVAASEGDHGVPRVLVRQVDLRHMAEGVQPAGALRRRRLAVALQHGGREHGVGAPEARDAAAADEVVPVDGAAARPYLGREARAVAVQVLDDAGAAEAEHRLGGAQTGHPGQDVLGLPEQLLRRQLAGEAGEVDGHPGQLDAGQAGDLVGDRRGGVRQDAFAAVAQVDGEQDPDRGAGGVLSEHAGGARVAQEHAVGDLGGRLELVSLGRPDERERPQRLSGEPDQRGQAAVGEAGAAGLEQHPPDRRLAVDALGDAGEREAAGVQIRGETPRGAGDGAEIDGEPGERQAFSTSSGRERPLGRRGCARPGTRAMPRPRSASRSGRRPPAGRGREVRRAAAREERARRCASEEEGIRSRALCRR